MKKQRPTIPISEWRVSIHLEETRNIQNQPGTPAHACDCEWCKKWKVCCEEVMPEEIKKELLRVGIELKHPTDLYKYQDNEHGNYLRVVYHAVGKILGGPNQWRDGLGQGKALTYHTIRENPFVSLVVFPQSQSFDESPIFENKAEGDLLRVDFRLCISENV